MRKRSWILAAAAAAAGAGLLAGDGLGSHPSKTAATRPNVVVIMSDDQTVESLRVMANVRTLIGSEGATFANSFATYSLCCPSRATYLTGQYAHTHGVMGNQPPEGGYDKLEPTHANTLPAWLRTAGYHTIHIGKYLNGYTADDGVPPGWTEWYGAVDPSTYSFYGYTLNENGRLVTYGSAPEDYQADVYTRKAVDAIRRRAPQGPFLLSVAYLAPHSGQPREPGDPVGMPTPVPAPRHQQAFDSEPLPAPPSLNELDISDKPSFIRSKPLLVPGELAAIQENYRQRLESLLAIDEGVAAIVGALRASGELSNTVVIFTADNGFLHGEHRVPNGKVLLYEPSIRVPLLVRGPGVPRGQVFTQLVGNIDVAPTIVDVAHAKAGRKFDGRSLYDLFEKPSTSWRDTIVVENQRSRGVRTGRYLYAEHSTGERELYDVASDPHELANLAGNPAYASVQADLARRLVALAGVTAAGNGLELRLSTKRGRGNCRRFGVLASVVGSDAHLVRSVAFGFGGIVVARDDTVPFEQLLYPPRAKPSKIRADIVLADGRLVTEQAVAPACPGHSKGG